MPSFSGFILFLCAFWAIVGPLVSPWIEERLEAFLLVLGLVAATAGGAWSEAVVIEALLRPLKLCGALLAGSLVFSFFHEDMRSWLSKNIRRLGLKRAAASAVILTGLSSAVVTMPIAVLALIELIRAMELERESEIKVAVSGAIAIGLGGGLTAIASPTTAVAMAKLKDAPYAPGTWYFLELLGPWIIPAIVSMGLLAGFVFAKPAPEPRSSNEDPLTLWNMLVLSGRMYAFVFGLVLLGAGLVNALQPLVLSASPPMLYWLNSVSAAIDGPTLAALQISPALSQDQIRYCLLADILAGGALITGSAPNIVAAQKLRIPAKTWALHGTPIAAFLMLFYFISLGVWTGG